MEFVDLKAQQRLIREQLDRRIASVMDHGRYIQGPEVAELEGRLAEFVGVRHCIAVSSGTDSLLLALMALGVGPGDEVVTTPFTFVATAEVIRLVGANPVYVDIDPATYNIDATAIEARLGERTRAIMPVSLFGQCADMDVINELALSSNIAVIEDAAQSFGATYKGTQSCALSTIGSTSFFPSKPLGCYGDGGALFTNDDTLAESMRELRIHGQNQRYHHSRIGINGRLDTIQAAVLLCKLDLFEEEVKQRQEVAHRYDELLGKIPGLVLPCIKADNTSVYAQYSVQVHHRDEIAIRMKEAGIPTAVHYPIPLHHQPAYTSNEPIGEFRNAEHVAGSILSLPMSPYLSEVDQIQVTDALGDICAKYT